MLSPQILILSKNKTTSLLTKILYPKLVIKQHVFYVTNASFEFFNFRFNRKEKVNRKVIFQVKCVISLTSGFYMYFLNLTILTIKIGENTGKYSWG